MSLKIKQVRDCQKEILENLIQENDRLQKSLIQEEARRKLLRQQIESQYSLSFIEDLGWETLMNIPVVQKDETHLGISELMKTKTIVRGVDASNHPVIIMVLKSTNTETKKTSQIIKWISRKPSSDKEEKNSSDDYITGSAARDANDSTRLSNLHIMKKKERRWIGRLLHGKEVKHPSKKNLSLQLAKE